MQNQNKEHFTFGNKNFNLLKKNGIEKLNYAPSMQFHFCKTYSNCNKFINGHLFCNKIKQELFISMKTRLGSCLLNYLNSLSVEFKFKKTKNSRLF